MIKIQKETIKYCLSCADSLKDIALSILPKFETKLEEYYKLFGITKFRKIRINYFDDIQEFRDFIFNIRKENTLPSYATGTYDKGMINAYISSDNIDRKMLHTASHETFHIMYLELILKRDYSKRIVWYDEGMAQFYSGEWDYLDDEEKFKNFFDTVKKNTKVLPNLNEIQHGSKFCNEEYNGYYLSYIAIRYLSEILSSEEFRNLMADFDKIKIIGNNIVVEAFEYYNNLFKLKSYN